MCIKDCKDKVLPIKQITVFVVIPEFFMHATNDRRCSSSKFHRALRQRLHVPKGVNAFLQLDHSELCASWTVLMK